MDPIPDVNALLDHAIDIVIEAMPAIQTEIKNEIARCTGAAAPRRYFRFTTKAISNVD